MSFTTQVQPLLADDAEIARVRGDAELAGLLGAVAHITGDLTLLRAELRPDPLKMREPQSGYTEAEQTLARQVILEGLRRPRDDQGGRAARPSTDELHHIMSFIVGTEVTDRYVPLLLEECAIHDLRKEHRRGWHLARELVPRLPCRHPEPHV